MATIPMFAPNGSTGEIPVDQVQAAQQAGFKKAFTMTSPEGKTGYIPEDRAQDALKAGFKLGEPDSKPTPSSFSPSNLISNVGRGLKELGQGLATTASDIGGAILPQAWGGDPLNNMQLVHHIVDPMQAEAQKARDPNTPAHLGHAIASGIPVIGPYAASLGEQAGQGDIGGAIARGGTQMLAPRAIGPTAELATRGAARFLLRGSTPEAAMEEALKLPVTMSDAERAAKVKTALDTELPISKGALQKQADLIDAYDQAITDEIAKDPNRPINPNAVANRLNDTKQRFGNQAIAQPDLDVIEAQRQQFLKERGALPGKPGTQPQPTGLLDPQGRPIMTQGTPATPPQPAPDMPAIVAQAQKRGTYQVLKGKFGEQGSAAVEAQKDLARGYKEELATAFPELKNLNADLSRQLDLQPWLERAVNRTANNRPIGIGGPIIGTAVKAASGSNALAGAALFYKAVIDNPMVKSRLAIAVSKANKIPISQAMAKVQAYSTSLGSYSAATGANSDDAAPSQ